MHTTSIAFHLAIPVDDLAAARTFYLDVLGCGLGRESDHWVDFDFFGHQLVAHLDPGGCEAAHTNEVDGEAVPVRHFGMVLRWDHWETLRTRLQERGIRFLIEPQTRFRGKAGEQATFFVRDPAGNALEFKTFRDPSRLFTRD